MRVINEVIRFILMSIDWCVYTLVGAILQLIFDLANTEIFSQTTINQFARRIYVILGLVMLFKIIMSFFQILVNPDSLNDKEKGAGNVLKRVVISLTLIVLVPSIFKIARQLQNYIMPIIPKVLLGVSSNEVENDIMNDVESVGVRLAWYSFVPFFQYDNDKCATGEIVGLPSTVENPGNIDRIGTMSDALSNVNKEDGCSTDEYRHKYKYRFLVSTAVGAYLVFVLVTVAVQIAIRAIKLSICEFAAPIPIASYVDAKASKNTFDKWVSTSLKVYADLFIHLITVYFILFVFLTIFQTENLERIYANLGGDGFRSALVTLFIIAGLLKFAKDAPKFLSDLLGLKVDGMGGIFKADGWKSLGGTIGAGLGAIGSGVGNAVYSWKNGDKAGAAFRGLAGLTSGAARGLKAAADGKGIKGSFIENVGTTTGKSHERVKKRFIARLSKSDRERELGKIKEKYDHQLSEATEENITQKYNDRISEVLRNRQRITGEYNDSKASLANKRGELNDQINDIRTTNDKLKSDRERLKKEHYEIDRRRIHGFATGERQRFKDIEEEIKKIDAMIDDNENKINTIISDDLKKLEADENKLEEKYISDLKESEKIENSLNNAMQNEINNIKETRKNIEKERGSAEKNVAREINPLGNFVKKVINSTVGMTSTSASSILEASSTLSSMRSTYYIGEAMKKLSEEGSKLTEVLSMGATYSEVASAYESLHNGKVDHVVIDGVTYDSGNSTDLGELFKKAEKEAAINYINAVKSGRISNTTLEEGLKQTMGVLDGLDLDVATKKDLINQFQKNPGNFFKSLTDVSKRLETEGKRRQAYEREQKKS